METVKCNLCGSEDYRFVYSMPDIHYFKEDWFNVVECKNCGLGFVNPRPNPLEMSKYYPPSFYNYFDEERDYHERRYRAEAKFLHDIVKDNRNKMLLDIGCANGDFPRFMQKKGWRVEGVEVSESSKPIPDFKVFRKDFSQIPVSEPCYDAITAWAVLEHVHDPMAYFMKVGEILKPDGLFVFLVTNFESSSSKYLFREDIPRHLYFFTEEMIKKYLEKAGLELVEADYTDKIYRMRPVGWLRYYIFRYLLRRTVRFEDIPETRMEYLTKHNLKNNIFSNLRYVITHPLTTLDRVLMPIYEKMQLISNNYGIIVYVARKPKHG